MEYFVGMLLKKSLGWVAGHLLFTSGMEHGEEVLWQFWDLHGNRALCRSQGGVCGGHHGQVKSNGAGTGITKQAYAWQLLTGRSVLKIQKWPLRR